VRSTGTEWKANLENMLKALENIKQLPVVEPGVYLHMGCGPQVLDGFINIDKYQEGEGILQVDMAHPPFQADLVSGIYSSHSLEHLPFREAKLALRNWNKVLKPGGKLYLAIPDLEEIMRILLDTTVPSHIKWNWYVYTLFGYQVDPDKYANNPELNLPSDSGQYHTCGFTKETIQQYLVESGYAIEDIYNYDGWSTPSIFVVASKVEASALGGIKGAV